MGNQEMVSGNQMSVLICPVDTYITNQNYTKLIFQSLYISYENPSK